MAWAEFWESTPLATRLWLEAWSERERSHNERAIVGAFHAAYFARFEKLGPKDLEKALGRQPKPTPQQTDQQIGAAIFGWLKTAEAINAARAGD